MEELLWIAAGIGWGIAGGYILGHRKGQAVAPGELRSLQLEVEDTLDKLTHKADRVRKRQVAAAAEQAAPAGEVLPVDRKADLRRRAAAAGFGVYRPVNNGGITQ